LEILELSKPYNKNGSLKPNGKPRATPCKWDKKSTELLLAYLKDHKNEVRKLKSRGITANRVKGNLWDGASSVLNYKYTANQCAVKWKNIKQSYMVKFISLFNKKIDIHFNKFLFHVFMGIQCFLL
jgi:hypothetical protein